MRLRFLELAGIRDGLVTVIKNMTEGTVLAAIFTVLLMSACAQFKDKALFVTKTSLGIEFESAPPSASIAYDRVEGFLGPRYENGGVPEVFGYFESDGRFVDPEIRQIYATGEAAAALLDSEPHTVKPPRGREGQNKVVFFGTQTVIGANITFSPNAPPPTNVVPSSFIFGFKRKEFSIIPLANSGTVEVIDGEKVMHGIYPPVFAVFSSRVAATSGTSPGIAGTNRPDYAFGQIFATGAAAVQIAQKSAVRACVGVSTSGTCPTPRRWRVRAVGA